MFCFYSDAVCSILDFIHKKYFKCVKCFKKCALIITMDNKGLGYLL